MRVHGSTTQEPVFYVEPGSVAPCLQAEECTRMRVKDWYGREEITIEVTIFVFFAHKVFS